MTAVGRKWRWPLMFVVMAVGSLIAAVGEDDFAPVWQREFVDQSGLAATICLILCLASPWFGKRGREWGLAAFGLGSLHGLAQMHWFHGWVVDDVARDGLLQWGAATWLILAALAATSFPKFNRLLGFDLFRELHGLVYLACVFLIVHVFMSRGQPWLVVGVMSALVLVLAVRVARR